MRIHKTALAMLLLTVCTLIVISMYQDRVIAQQKTEIRALFKDMVHNATVLQKRPKFTTGI